jgi:CarD family transcriptional regulator
MQLSIGDKVIYPRHGAGQITGVKHQELVEGFEHYYVIEIFDKRLIIHVPMRKMDELGVRPVMPRAELSRVLDTLGSGPRQLPEDIGERQERIREKLKMGGPIQVAEAVRDLAWRERLARLSKTDSDLLSRGRELLAAEMALVTDTEVTDAEQMIDTALTVAMASETR